MSEELEKTAEITEDEIAESEAVETEEVVEDADNDNNEADFSDGEGEDGEEGEGTGDDSESKQEPAKDDKPWKNEKNAEAARLRREAERKAEIKKARNEAIIETLNGVNPYTNEKIEDEADVEEYLTMKEIEKSGKDPVTDYSRFLKSREKEQKEAEQAEAVQKDWFQKDKEEFASKYPDVDLSKLSNDEMFKAFSDGKIGKVSMTKIYADYKALEKISEERAKTKAAQILANNAASPGKLSSTNQGSPNYFTRQQVQAMSKEEVKENYDKIMSSMERWNK